MKFEPFWVCDLEFSILERFVELKIPFIHDSFYWPSIDSVTMTKWLSKGGSYKQSKWKEIMRYRQYVVLYESLRQYNFECELLADRVHLCTVYCTLYTTQACRLGYAAAEVEFTTASMWTSTLTRFHVPFNLGLRTLYSIYIL